MHRMKMYETKHTLKNGNMLCSCNSHSYTQLADIKKHTITNTNMINNTKENFEFKSYIDNELSVNNK